MKDDVLNRLKVNRGEQLGQSKLTDAKVIEARMLYDEYREKVKELQSSYSIKGLAKRYGVHERTMEKALSGITWSHII